MYDISFVRKSLSLRQQILEGKPLENLFEKFESIRNKNPKVYQIETTNACNMTCIMCPRTDLMDREVGHMEMAQFKSLVDQLSGFTPDELELWDDYVKKQGLKNSLATEEDYFYHFICSQAITLHGFGEPLMDNKIVERVQHCTRRGIKTYFSANPVNARLKIMDQLGDAGLSYLKFHLDGIDNTSQKYYRGRVDRTYEETQKRILKIIELFNSKNYPTRVILTKLKFNRNDEPDQKFLDFWEENGVFAYIKNQHNRWLYEEDDAVENSAGYMQGYCDFPWTSMSVLQNGDVVSCPMEYNGEDPLGNINEQTIEEIWNGPKYRALRKMHIEGNFPEGHFCVSKCDTPILNEKLQQSRNRKFQKASS